MLSLPSSVIVFLGLIFASGAHKSPTGLGCLIKLICRSVRKKKSFITFLPGQAFASWYWLLETLSLCRSTILAFLLSVLI